MRSAAEQTGVGSQEVLASAQELGRQSEVLQGQVDDFLSEVRSA